MSLSPNTLRTLAMRAVISVDGASAVCVGFSLDEVDEVSLEVF